jgi:hypothetical protein
MTPAWKLNEYLIGWKVAAAASTSSTEASRAGNCMNEGHRPITTSIATVKYQQRQQVAADASIKGAVNVSPAARRRSGRSGCAARIGAAALKLNSLKFSRLT